MKKENIIILLVTLSLAIGIYNFTQDQSLNLKQDLSLIFWVPSKFDNYEYKKLHDTLYYYGATGWSRFKDFGGWIDDTGKQVEEEGYIYLVSNLKFYQIKKLYKFLNNYLKEEFKQDGVYIIILEDYKLKRR